MGDVLLGDGDELPWGAGWEQGCWLRHLRPITLGPAAGDGEQ